MNFPSGFKPMLSGKADLASLKYPVLASPKLDGVRALVSEDRVYARSLKLIPNHFVQRQFGLPKYEGLDGELIVGPPNAPNAYNATISGVMSSHGEPEVIFHVFDTWMDPMLPFRKRLELTTVRAHGRVNIVPHTWIADEESLKRYEAVQVGLGYEGIMLRSLHGRYKHGRSTVNEGWLLKLKRWEDGEATIVGFEEKMHNANEAKTNELGHTERSSHKANKHGMNTLGALIVKHPKFGEFNIGTGFDEELRQRLWNRRHLPDGEGILGAVVKFKYQPAGVLEKPRFPVFIGFRDPRDL